MTQESILNIPSEILKESKRFFKPLFLSEAQKILRFARVSISFSKGDTQNYFIVSGIIKTDRSYEAKVIFKNRLNDSSEGPLTTSCSCNEWSNEFHCPHAACLYLNFNLQEFYNNEDNFKHLNEMHSLPQIGNLGTTCVEYGTMVPSASKLVGANPNSTYTSVQYLLHSKKVVNFPLPKSFEGKLILNINTSGEHLLSFRYIDRNELDIFEISLFENLYLFNWQSGEAFHLPANLKDFLHRVRINRYYLNTNDILQYIHECDISEFCKVMINGTFFEDIAVKTPYPRIHITPAAGSGLIDFCLVFHADDEKIIPLPIFSSLFSYQGGMLSTFKRKKDGYDFINHLVHFFDSKSQIYKQMLLSSSKKERIHQIIDALERSKETIVYDEINHYLCYYDNYFLKTFYSLTTTCFGEMFYRFSEFHFEERRISYQLSASVLFQGLSDFYHKLTPFGVAIFYDRNEIATWSSRIRFERRQSTTSWFDLELHVSDDELELIKKADLDSGMVITKAGLVMLSKEQKDLLRFMKKYTQYEGEENSKDAHLNRFILPFNRARIFELFELKKLGIEGALTEEEENLCHRLATLETMPEYEVPARVKNILRPYQVTGYNWLRFLYENKLGACLADDMGLGKTIQTIAFIESIYDQIDKVLVVCPVSILMNWENEFKKFSEMKIHIYHGGDRNLPPDTKIILTSYGVMKKEAHDVFSNINFDILVLDEVQQLKNIRSLGAYAARKLKANFRICLTGTPVENDLSEFYNILDLGVPGVWGDLQFIRTVSNKKSRLLARKIAKPFILRRTKAQVLTDLPDKIENNVYLQFTEEEQDSYKDMLLAIRNRIAHSPSTRKYGEILKGLLELRQSCLWQKKIEQSHFGMIASTKINFLLENLEQILEEGHQAIVFSQFTTYLDIIQNIIHERHWKFSRIDGSQSIKRRQKEVDLFQEGKNPVFLISLKAGGVGLNLTAASYVFIMDPWWNPAVENQAIDRAHRIGQKNTLTVYRPLIKGSVEEKILKLQEMKKELFHDLLTDDNDQYFTGKLTVNDFEMLLN